MLDQARVVVTNTTPLIALTAATAGDAPWSTKSGVDNQTTHVLRKKLIECQRRTWVIERDIPLSQSVTAVPVGYL